METRTGMAELEKGNDQGMKKTDEGKANVLCDYFTYVGRKPNSLSNYVMCHIEALV